jgi:hypothetical protein
MTHDRSRGRPREGPNPHKPGEAAQRPSRNGRPAGPRVLRCRRAAADLARLREYAEILGAAASGADGVGLATPDARAFLRRMAAEARQRLNAAYAILHDARTRG